MQLPLTNELPHFGQWVAPTDSLQTFGSGHSYESPTNDRTTDDTVTQDNNGQQTFVVQPPFPLPYDPLAFSANSMLLNDMNSLHQPLPHPILSNPSNFPSDLSSETSQLNPNPASFLPPPPLGQSEAFLSQWKPFSDFADQVKHLTNEMTSDFHFSFAGYPILSPTNPNLSRIHFTPNNAMIHLPYASQFLNGISPPQERQTFESTTSSDTSPSSSVTPDFLDKRKSSDSDESSEPPRKKRRLKNDGTYEVSSRKCRFQSSDDDDEISSSDEEIFLMRKRKQRRRLRLRRRRKEANEVVVKKEDNLKSLPPLVPPTWLPFPPNGVPQCPIPLVKRKSEKKQMKMKKLMKKKEKKFKREEEPKERKKRKKRPNTCPLCKKTFSQSCHVLRHVRDQHNSDAAKKFVCSICQTAFSQNSNLRIHSRTHSKRLDISHPFLCKFCPAELDEVKRRFTRKSSLDRHVENLHPDFFEEYKLRKKTGKVKSK